jgi:glycosyltransferase involved in cell wall biosynthesis
MAAGCPVVATAVGGIPDIVKHEENGLLVPSEDKEALAAAVLRLLAHEAWAKELGNEARRTIISRHSAQPIARRLSDLYQQALA